MKTLELTETSMGKLDQVARDLEATHPATVLNCELVAGNSAVCTPCKGGCGSLSSLIGVAANGQPSFAAH